MSARRRKSLNESEALQGEVETTPEMEAFRKGIDPASSLEAQHSEPEPTRVEDEAAAAKGKNKKLVVVLESDLYEAFATVCFKQKKKMARVVREWIEDYTQEN